MHVVKLNMHMVGCMLIHFFFFFFADGINFKNICRPKD